MAVAYVSSDAVGGPGTADTTSFGSVVVSPGDLLLAIAGKEMNATGDILTGVSFGATPLAQLFQFNPYDGVTDVTAVAGFYGFVSGTETLTITFVSIETQRDGGYYVLSGVDTVTPFGTLLQDLETPTAIGIGSGSGFTAVPDALYIDVVGLRGNRASSMAVTAADQTFRHAVPTSSTTLATSTKVGGLATSSMAWSWTTGLDYRIQVGIPVLPVSGQAVRVKGMGLLLGVG